MAGASLDQGSIDSILAKMGVGVDEPKAEDKGVSEKKRKFYLDVTPAIFRKVLYFCVRCGKFICVSCEGSKMVENIPARLSLNSKSGGCAHNLVFYKVKSA